MFCRGDSRAKRPNDQIPNPNQAPNPNDQGLGGSSLGIGNWDLIGIWDLVIGISIATNLLSIAN
jgi:hypothetical protein